jgi:hypothetical protein
MRIGIRKLLVLGGTTTILATAGFAYMATNTVAQSSAGQGNAPVTGYSVSGIQYSAEQGWGQQLPVYSISTVKFILTSDDNSAPGNGNPAQVKGAIKVSGVWQNLDTCNPTTTWAVNGSGQGFGGFACNVAGGAVPVVNVTGLDVEANQ